MNEAITVADATKDSLQQVDKAPLKLPASVALIMVPGENPQSPLGDVILRQAAEKLKQQLLAEHTYVKSVGILSGSDARRKLSLAQIRDLYGTDIAVLVSHQQGQRNQQSGAAGLADATIVGAFLVPGVETKTVTVVEGTVIHIPSNSIIFRASGTDERSVHSTTHAERSSADEESVKGMLAATVNFGHTLTKELGSFDNFDLSKAVPLSALAVEGTGKPSAANDYWAGVDTYKKTGGGTLGGAGLVVAAAICCAAARRRT